MHVGSTSKHVKIYHDETVTDRDGNLLAQLSATQTGTGTSTGTGADRALKLSQLELDLFNLDDLQARSVSDWRLWQLTTTTGPT